MVGVEVGDDVGETCVALARVVTADVAVSVAMDDDGGMQRFRGASFLSLTFLGGAQRRRPDLREKFA